MGFACGEAARGSAAWRGGRRATVMLTLIMGSLINGEMSKRTLATSLFAKSSKPSIYRCIASRCDQSYAL